MSIARIGIIGGGAWGTTLALLAARRGLRTSIWVREADVAAAINQQGRNPFLPSIPIEGVTASTDYGIAAGCDALLFATPAQHLRNVCRGMHVHVQAATPAVVCAKGIEENTGALLSEVVGAELPGAIVAILSGPTFAPEVARGLPAAVTLACGDADVGQELIDALGSPTFRPYLSADVIGAQVGGSVKNVLAIACGIVAGRRLGDNARAALVTRGLAEIQRLGRVLGAQPATLTGLSGLGDLVLTCTSEQSRNFSLGVALGRGQSATDVLASRTSVAEGVATAGAVVTLAARLGIEMPIAAAVDAIVNRGAAIDEIVTSLLARPFRAEGE